MANDVWTAPAGPAAGVASLSEMQEQRTDNIYVIELVMEGDQSASGKTHRHGSGTLANRPAAGNAGRLYFATDLGVTFIDDGTLWRYFSHVSSICDRLYDDFHTQNTTALATDGFLAGWEFEGGNWGTASCVFGNHSTVYLQAGAASGAWLRMSPRGGTVPYIECVAGHNYPLIWESYIDLQAVNNVDMMIGCFDTISTARPPEATAEGFGFRYQDGDNYLAYVRRAAGDVTTFDTGVAPSTAAGEFDLLRVEIDSTTALRFYIDNVEVADEGDTGVPPTAGGAVVAPMYLLRSNAAATKELAVDYVDLFYKRYIV